MVEETLLQGLCRVNGQQGGTIWQFFPSDPDDNLPLCMRAYRDYVRCGFTFPSRAAFEKLAAFHHLTIKWS